MLYNRLIVPCTLQTSVGEWKVDAAATLKLQMVSYSNPSGRDYSGACCDLFCWSSCDTIFSFALDVGNRHVTM